jgi:hypothetical protein
MVFFSLRDLPAVCYWAISRELFIGLFGYEGDSSDICTPFKKKRNKGISTY